MSTLRIIVLGAGSIGMRHARNFAALGATVTVMDPDRERIESLECGAIYDEAALADADGIVIASPTSLHAAQARTILATTDAAVMVEKPVGLLDDDLADLESADPSRIMVGFNLRLFGPNQRFAELLDSGRAGDPRAFRFWFGSWLPAWRPGTDYRTCYSARRELGGGVLLDVIHELDLARWMAGPDLRVVGALVSQVSDLDLDVEDTVRALLVNDDDVPVSIELDYLSRRYRRGIEVVGSEATLRLDWDQKRITIENGDGVTHEPFCSTVDESYENEASRFLALIENGTAPPVGIADGVAVNRLAQRIREHAS